MLQTMCCIVTCPEDCKLKCKLKRNAVHAELGLVKSLITHDRSHDPYRISSIQYIPLRAY